MKTRDLPWPHRKGLILFLLMIMGARAGLDSIVTWEFLPPMFFIPQSAPSQAISSGITYTPLSFVFLSLWASVHLLEQNTQPFLVTSCKAQELLWTEQWSNLLRDAYQGFDETENYRTWLCLVYPAPFIMKFWGRRDKIHQHKWNKDFYLNKVRNAQAQVL